MSSIRPDPRLDRPGLDALERLSLDGARGRDLPQGQDAAPLDAVAELLEAPSAPTLDPGEAVLDAPAWTAAGPRLLPREDGLRHTLASMDLAQAADRAADAVLAALA